LDFPCLDGDATISAQPRGNPMAETGRPTMKNDELWQWLLHRLCAMVSVI
jgi:hypothetical protein